jgi:hypothetical protein
VVHPHVTLVWSILVVEKYLLFVCPPELLVEHQFVDLAHVLPIVAAPCYNVVMLLSLLGNLLLYWHFIFGLRKISVRVVKELFNFVIYIGVLDYLRLLVLISRFKADLTPQVHI